MATGPAKRAAASALNKAAKTAKATALRQPLRPAPASPTATTKPTGGVKASSPLSQMPPPPSPPPPAATAAPPPQSTNNLTREALSGGAPPRPPPGGSEGKRRKGKGGEGEEGTPQQEQPQQQPPRTPFNKWKAAIWTLAFTAVTVTGTIYGAGLKTQKEWKEEKHKVQEATVQEKIETLVNRRAQLFKTKIEIEQKLADVRERMRLEKEKEEKEKSGAVAMPRR